MVKRYDMEYGVNKFYSREPQVVPVQGAQGAWVSFEDYAALAAQVGALHEMAGRANAHLTKGYATQNFNQVDCNLALSALAEINSFTPQHHLRQVRADAVLQFAKQYKNKYEMVPATASPTVVEFANQYADSILAGKE